jgi:hypothetical protein
VTIVEEGPQIEPAGRSRPWWFAPAVVGIMLGSVVGVAVLPPQLGKTSPSQEQELVDRLQAIGVSAAGIGQLHFDATLGASFPSREFSLGTYGIVYVIFPAFVDGQGDIRVCASPNGTGQGRVVYVDGQITSSVNAEPWVYLVSSRYFVIAPNDGAASVIQRGLGVTRAPC